MLQSGWITFKQGQNKFNAIYKPKIIRTCKWKKIMNYYSVLKRSKFTLVWCKMLYLCVLQRLLLEEKEGVWLHVHVNKLPTVNNKIISKRWAIFHIRMMQIMLKFGAATTSFDVKEERPKINLIADRQRTKWYVTF